MRRCRWALFSLGLLLPPAGADEPLELIDRLTFVAQYDDQALYLAARMEDLCVVGTHTELNQNVRQDDDFELFLDTGFSQREIDRQNRRASGRPDQPAVTDDRCWLLMMSAAGGAAFLRGTGTIEDPWRPAPPRTADRQTIRQNTVIYGTLNDTADADVGWSIELRLPWKLLGLDGPPVGQTWGFNVVRHMRGEQDARFSYSPAATLQSGDLQPERWARILFREGTAGWVTASEQHVTIAPRVPMATADDGTVAPRPPDVDGRLASGEWPRLVEETVGLAPDRLVPLAPVVYAPPPDAEPTLPPGCDFFPRPASTPEPRASYNGSRYVVASYQTHFQDDARMPGAARLGTRGPDGASILACQPAGGLGPWFSSLRVAWHKDQLARAAEAGIDLVLVEWWGDHESRGAWADQMLGSLATALYELDDQSVPHPEIGVRIPLEALEREVGGPPDLTQQVTQAILYQMIRDFYWAIPPAARGILPDGDRRACAVALERPPRELRATPTFLGYCEQRFDEDFGLDLLWLGSQLWGRRRMPVDALISFDAGGRWWVSEFGRITAASLGPGFDDSLVAEQPQLVARNASRTLRDRFRKSLEAPYDWLVLASWNDFLRGDNLAASREYGDSDERAAAAVTAQFNAPNEEELALRLRRCTVPPEGDSGGTVMCPVRVVNTGLKPWQDADDVRLGAAWLADDEEPLVLADAQRQPYVGEGRLFSRIVSERGGRSEPLVSAGRRVVDTMLPVIAVDADGKPLAPGEYRLRLDGVAGEAPRRVPVLDTEGRVTIDESGAAVTREETGPRWLTPELGSALVLHVTVTAADGTPGEAAAILAAGVPGRLESGQSYPIVVTVRNDGRLAWGAGYRLAARYERVTTAPVCRAEEPPTPLTGWLPLAEIAAAADSERVAPGEVVTLPVRLPVADAGGAALPLDLGPRAACRLSLAVMAPSGQPVAAATPFEQTVQLIRRDWGAGFGTIEAPNLAAAGGKMQCRVNVVNTAFTPWPAGETALVWHWYRWDGLESHFDAGRAQLAEPLETGRIATIEAEVTAPDTTGAYYLVFDLAFADGTLASRQPGTFGRQTARVPVAVSGGAMVPLALGRFFNLAAQSFEGEPPADFDGRGNSLPAEDMPPFFDDIAGGLYPTALLAEPKPGQGDVPFWYPEPREHKQNAITCNGQTVAVQPQRARRIHLLAASIAEPRPRTFSVVTAAGPRALPAVTIPTWDQPPSADGWLGFATRRRVTRDGLEAKRCWLHHIRLDLDAAADVTGIALPDATELRILAITIETEQP